MLTEEVGSKELANSAISCYVRKIIIIHNKNMYLYVGN